MGGPGGTITSEIWHQFQGLRPTVRYFNDAMGSTDVAWVVSTGMPTAASRGVRAVVVQVGINDVAAGRTWGDLSASFDTIKTLAGSKRLFVMELTPWTAGNDTQAATVRSINASLATWCAGNGSTLISCHDAMGQVRASTGQLDDLATAYDYDGIHYTQAGVDKMATLIKAAWESVYGA